MKRAIVPLMAVMVSAGLARAEDLPRFDIRAHCIAKASDRGGVTACQRTEEAKRATLVERWPAYPKQRKHFCVQSVAFLNRAERSYAGLASCLDEASTS